MVEQVEYFVVTDLLLYQVWDENDGIQRCSGRQLAYRYRMNQSKSGLSGEWIVSCE
jgi:hypothetical protein